VQAVLEYASSAARQAASLRAHREAAAQYARALRFAAGLPTAEHTELLEAYAVECAIIDQLPQAVGARKQAAALWHQAGNVLKVGENLSHLAGLHLNAGQNAEGEAASRAALEVLSALPETVQHARAYQMQAHIRMLNRDHQEAVHWGEQALTLAKRLGDLPIMIGVYNTLGSALVLSGRLRGRVLLEQSLCLALDAGLDSRAGLAYLNLGSAFGERYLFAEADRYLEAGVAFSRERDLDSGRHYMEAWLALSHGYQGRWSEAGAAAGAVLRISTAATISRIMALSALGRIRVRRGDPEIWSVLDEALELSDKTRTLQRLGLVHAVRAEAAWLAGDLPKTLAEARAAYDMAFKSQHPWFAGELAYWQWKGGEPEAIPTWAAPPFVMQMQGDWAGAAQAWKALKCPYEAARALCESGEELALREALSTFETLGAGPMAQWVKTTLRSLGLKGGSRGPRPATKANPAGLTARELEVLGLLEGLQSDKQIARQLGLSAKTVGHHVSAILAKLGGKSRAEAVRAALDLGIITRN